MIFAKTVEILNDSNMAVSSLVNQQIISIEAIAKNAQEAGKETTRVSENIKTLSEHLELLANLQIICLTSQAKS